MDQSVQQEGRGRPSGPSYSSWIDSEIRVFLLEWEVVEQAIGHQGQNMYMIARAIHQRLYQRGLRKTWQDCLQLLLDMVTLYNRLCHVRPGIEPLFSPYSENLHRILGHRLQGSHFPGPLYDGAGNPMLPMYSQPPTVVPSPVYHPWDYGFPAPSGENQGNPSPMSNGDSMNL